jgi:nitrogen fixation protein FixH
MSEGRGAGPWPWIVAGLLAAMVTSSLLFLRIAVANPDALVVSDARSAKRAYHEDVRAERRGAALGWRVELDARTRGDAADVRVRVHDAEGAHLAAERVSLRRVRPAEGGLDETIDLEPAGRAWTGRVALPRAGRWHLHVRVETADEAVERTFAVHRAPPS